MKIIVSQEIESVCPTFVGACVEAYVENSPYYNPQNEMFSHFGMKRYNFKNETQLFKVIPHTSKIQKNRPASPERNTFEGS